MDDARRFFRYVVPGLVFLFLVILYLVLSLLGRKDILSCFFSQFFNNSWSSVGVIITAFVASGAIGFILTSIYYVCYWSNCWDYLCLPSLDHRRVLEDLVEHKYLQIKNRRNEEIINMSLINKSAVWCIFTAYWREHLENSKRIKGAKEGVHRLGDIMHGLGTTFIGSILAIPVWIFIYLLIIGPRAFCSLYSPCVFLLYFQSSSFLPYYYQYSFAVSFIKITQKQYSNAKILWK